MKMTRLFSRGARLLVFVSSLLIGCTSSPALAVKYEKIHETLHVKQHRAKMDAAAYIFRYYNRNLSEDKAKEYAKYVMEAAHRYSIEPSLITAIIIKESTAKVNARSRYAVGLMQVYWQLHKKTIGAQFPHIRTEKILMEPRNNIMVGTWLFSQYMLSCKGDVTKALRRYLGSKATQYVALVNKYRGHFSKRMNFNLQHASKRSA
ncbi:MAG: transglycosylase SLT domain-containing protein [Pyramidobacter sp.]|jgi:soluble lytic murein transglycosylase-like protein|nr:transglycosylase SLT domain-containing protein [Schwartzia sp. (in: firmicutes)]MBP3836133.1 transglycosylase SLT domain-containing protein [Pyramidobacter sp.]